MQENKQKNPNISRESIIVKSYEFETNRLRNSS